MTVGKKPENWRRVQRGLLDASEAFIELKKEVFKKGANREAKDQDNPLWGYEELKKLQGQLQALS